MKTKRIDLNMRIIDGIQRYEDRYGHYLKIFEDIANTPTDVAIEVNGAPFSWTPLLQYLGCKTFMSVIHFESADAVVMAIEAGMPPEIMEHGYGRTTVEALCCLRPELVDAMWKCDMQWKTPRIPRDNLQKEFIVTNNGSFHRPEVLDFIDKLWEYTPKKKNVVIVPCAADKPYPSLLHQAVLDMMPDDFYLMNATGVLGLVPQDMWPVMPWYDSGIPNEWRLMNTVREYFMRHPHDRIIVYCDFYNIAIQKGLDEAGYLEALFVNDVKFYEDYIDLLDADRLELLREAFKQDYVPFP